MTSPGGKPVAQVSVRVVPDVDFSDLERQLGKIKDHTVKVDFDVDKEQLERDLESIRADITIPVGFNLDEIRDDIERATAGQRGEVPVDLKVNDKGIRDQVTKAVRDIDPVDIPTDVNRSTLRAKISSAAESLKGNIRAIPVDLDIGTALAAAKIARFFSRELPTITVPVDVDIDRFRISSAISSITKAFSSISSTVAPIFRGIESGLVDAFSGVGSKIGKSLSVVSSALTGITRGFGGMRGGILAAITGALKLSQVVLVAGAAAGALTIAGAAVTAAWGAVSTAIAGIPAAIALIGAPLAAVALGLDGIKAAAKSITPEFDALKARVSETFEKGLTPVFRELATIFPKVEGSVNRVAQSLVGIAAGLSQFIASSAGVNLIRGLFDQAAFALAGMKQGILDVVEASLLMANQRGIYDALTTAVNVFGAEFKRSVIDLMSDNTLTAAFQGLEGTLSALARGFVNLVDNGLQVFANAAPGVNAFLNELTSFFNRFNWDSLGRSVGGVFQGLADTLRGVPQGVIDGIAVGFDRLAGVFQNAGFQRALQDIIALIPQVLGMFASLVEGAARLGQAFAGTVDVVSGFVSNMSAMWDFFEGQITFDQLDAQITAGRGQIDQGLDTIKRSMQDWATTGVSGAMAPAASSAAAGMQGINAALASNPINTAPLTAPLHAAVPAVQTELAKLGPSATTSLRNADLAIEQGVKNWEATTRAGAAAVPPAVGTELDKVPGAANTALAPLQQLEAVQNMKPQFTTAAIDSMNAMAVGVEAGLTIVQQKFKAGLDTVSTNSNSSFGLIGQSFTAGMTALAATVTAGIPGIVAAFNFQNVGLQVGLAFQGLVGSFTLGMQSLAATVTAGMPGVVAAFNFTNIGLQVGLAFQQLVGSVTLGMQSIANTVTTNMALVNQAFNFTNIGLTVGLAFQGLVGSVTLGMQSIALAVTTGMTQVVAAFNFANIGLNIGLAFQGLVGTVQLGMASLAATVSSGMPAIAAAFNFQGVGAAVGQAFLGMVGTVRLGMQSIQGAVVAGMAGVATAIATGVANSANQFRLLGAAAAIANGQIAQAAQGMTQAMQAMSVAITAAMVAVVNAVRNGVAQAAAAANLSVGQFRAAGVNMGRALADGLRSQLGAVRAAAAQLGAAAAAGMRSAAQIRSPSRVFMELGSLMGEGLAVGLESSAPRLNRAADNLVSDAVTTADKIAEAFAGDSWAADFNSKIEHSFGEMSSAMSNKDVVGQLRNMNGTASQSTMLMSTMIAVLQAILAQGQGSGGVALGAQASRQQSELGAF